MSGESKREKSPISARIIAPIRNPILGLVVMGECISSIMFWMAVAVLCQLDDGQHVKNIYWNYHCYSAEIVWEDDDTVIINGVLFENVEKDTYDFRRDK